LPCDVTTTCSAEELAEIEEQRGEHCGGGGQTLADHAHAHCDETPPTCLTELAAISADADHDAFDAVLCADALDTSTCTDEEQLEVAEQLECHCGGDGGQSDDQVCRHEVTVQVPCSGTLHVNFLSGIDQAEDDESWAFSDVRVIARP
jgi:hypothetical protein